MRRSREEMRLPRAKRAVKLRLFLEPNQATFAVARLQQDEAFWVSTNALLSLEGRLSPEAQHPHAALTKLCAKEAMGEVTLAPALPGVVKSLTLEDERLWVQSASLLGASTSLEISAPQTRGASFLLVEGSGELLLSGFGALWELDLLADDSVSLENIVAFDDSLSYTVKRIGGLAVRLFSAGPVVCQFQSAGNIFVQSRSPREFGERFHQRAGVGSG